MKHYLQNSLRALFLSLAVLLSLPMLAVEVEIGEINYDLNTETKQATVIYKRSGKYYGKIAIPEFVKYEGVTYSVTSIGDGAFEWCEGISLVIIPNSVTEIGNNTYSYCRDLESVTIPDAVTRIGDEAFFGCENLSKVHCNATTPPNIGEKVFSYDEYIYDYKSFYSKPHTKLRNIKCKIYVPTASVNSYKTANGWSNYSNNIIGYDF